jgi:outer membrane protein assembly factor BamA
MRAFLILLSLMGACAARADHAPGDTAKVLDSTSLIVFPIAFYAPETRLGGALAGGYYRHFPERDRPSALEVQILYTQRAQYAVSGKLSHWLKRLSGFGSLGISAGEFPDQFYGVGNGARETDMEKFSARTFSAEGEANREIAPHLRLGGLAGWAKQSMLATDSGGSLRRGAVTGAGSWMGIRLAPRLAFDSRNSTYFPTTGELATFTVGAASRYLGGDFDFGDMQVDARKYLAVPGGVLALQGVATAMWGEIPFPMLAKVGGSEMLRGYYQGRYRDRDLACLQSEYRFRLWRSLGGAAFASAGAIADGPARLAEAPLRYGYGGGLRYRLNDEGVNLRADMAFPREGDPAVYVTFMEAF